MPLSPTFDPVPHHGDRGQQTARAPKFPRTLTVAISRQAGARGNTIAGRVGRKLGWQVVDQEMLEHIARQGGAVDELSAAAREWAEERLVMLRRNGTLSNDGDAIEMARVILTLGALGEVILVGRGAGHILPHASTLHVRVVAPRADRVAYLSQWQRLTPHEAEQQVDIRDRHRTQYLLDHLNADPSDPINYDLTVNSSLLGEALTAEVIVQAAKAKLLGAEPDDA